MHLCLHLLVYVPDSSHKVLEIVDCCNVVVVHFNVHIWVDPHGRGGAGRRGGGGEEEGWRENRWREGRRDARELME